MLQKCRNGGMERHTYNRPYLSLIYKRKLNTSEKINIQHARKQAFLGMFLHNYTLFLYVYAV